MSIKSIRHSLVLGILISLFLIYSPGWAVLDWDGDGGDTDFDTAGNWAGGAAPVVGDNSDSLAFDATGGANRTVTGADAGVYAGLTGISFAGAAGAYSIAGTGSFSFNAAATITGNGGLTHNLNTIGIVTTGAGLTFAGSDSYTVGGVISGTTITKSGSGTLTLSGANTYTGTTTISAGTLKVSGGSAIADTGAVSLANNATAVFELLSSETIGSLAGGGATGGNVTLNANTLTVGDASNTTYSGVISGTGELTKQGAGALTLSGNNTYTGITNLNAGTIILGHNSALGTGAGAILTLGGAGTLRSNNNARTVSNAIALGANALTVSGASNLALSGVISGTGSLTTNMTANADTLTLSGTNTYSGGTTLTKGTIILGNDAALGTTGLTLGGNGTLQSNDDARSVSNTIANGGNTLTVSGTSNLTLSGIISGTGALTKSGAGTLTLSGTNTYTGTTTISAGTLKVSGGSAIADTGAVSLDDVAGAVFELLNSETIGSLAGGGTTGGNVTLNANTLTVGDASNTTYSGAISGTGELTKQGAGALTLSGNNTYTGITNLNAGRIILGADAALGTGGLTLGGAGTLQSNDDARSVSNTIATGGNALTVSGARNLALSGVISGTGSLTTNMTANADTLTLSGTNTYSGGTTLTKGTIILGADAALGTTGLTLGGNGTLQSNDDARTVSNLIALGDNTLTFSGTNNATLSGVISGAGAGSKLTKAGTSTLTLSGINTYAGTTTISAGTLKVSGGFAIADTGAVSLDDVAGAIFELSASETIGSLAGGGTTGGNVTLNANTLTVGDASNTTYSGVISGTGALTKQGAGALTLSGTNTHSGGTTLNAGRITLGADAALGTGGLTLGGAGTLRSNNDARAVSNLIALGGNTLTFSGTNNATLSGVISGAGADSKLTKAGTSTLTLSGINTYAGTTTISAGTLKVSGGSAIADTGAVSLANNATAVFELLSSETIGSLTGGGATGGNVTLNANTLTVGDATSTTYSGVISGTGALTKQGAGAFTLSGVNTYAGLTDITAGTLTGAFTVAGDLTVSNGGTFAPGSSIGTTTIGGNYVQNAGSTLEVEVSKTGGADFLDVTGTATLAAGSAINVLDISPTGSLILTGDTFNIIEADGGVTDNGPTITDNSAVLSFSGLVSGNNYQLVATRETFASNVSGGNRSGVLGAIDSDLSSATGDYITLINALTALNSAQLNDAAEKLSPLPYASTTSASLRTTQRMADNLANYLSARRLGVEQLVTNNTQSREHQLLIADASSNPEILGYVIRENERIAKKQQEDGKISGFFRPFGMFYEHDSTPKLTGFDAKAVGAQFGFDKRFGSNLIMGIGGGYSHSFINFKESRGKSDTDSFRVGPYATYFKDDFFLDTSVSIGFHNIENKRNIQFGTINRTAEADYYAYDLSAYIGGGYNFHIDKWTITPTTSLQYIRYYNMGFKETGAGAAGLDVDASTSQSLRSKLGVTLSTITELHRTKIVPELFAGWAHEFMNNEDLKARFVEGTAKFTTDVDGDRDDSVYFGAGISALLKKNIPAFVRYEGEYSSGNSINALNVGVTILF